MSVWDEIIKSRLDSNGSLRFPVYLSSAFNLPEGERYRYSRENNPTVEELARVLSLTEGSENTTCFSSGMAAVSTTFMSILRPETKLLMTSDCFARTYGLAHKVFRQWGVNIHITDPGIDNLLSVNFKPDVIFTETISNPLTRFYDQSLIRSHFGDDVIIISDSTLSTAFNYNSIQSGANVSLQSLSKFASGHNDAIGGSSSGSSKIIGIIDQMRRNLGGSMDPLTAFLIKRGIETLPLRMDKINRNALEISKMLMESPHVEGVLYPLLNNHPDYKNAAIKLSGGGGIVTFYLKDEIENITDHLNKLKKIPRANTLGGIETGISHPFSMSHRSLSPDEMKRVGINRKMLRLSVGIEDVDYIWGDLKSIL